LLRAFDQSDLPPGLATSASAELVKVAIDVAEELQHDAELACTLRECGKASEVERSRTFLDTLFAAREYHWLKYYMNFQPRELEHTPVDVGSLPPGTRLRRCNDASAMGSTSGALLINGYCIQELPEEWFPIVRFCMGLYTGASGQSFYLSDVPGSEDAVTEAVQLLFDLNGLELAVSTP